LLPQCGHSSPLASRLFSYFHTTHQPRLKSYTAPFTPLLTLHIQGNEFEKTETNHTHPDLHCVFCALKDLFANYSYSDEFMIPPTELRRALSVQFAGEARFKIGEMYDATETLIAVLGYLHNVFVGTEGKEDVPCEPMCLVHQVFSMNFCDRTECPCGATSEPSLSSTFVYPVYVAELRRTFKDLDRRNIRFDGLLSILNDSEVKRCPDHDITKCRGENRNQKFLQNVPRVFTINLVWASSAPTVEEICQTLTLIAPNKSLGIDLASVFYGLEKAASYAFRGMIAYYGRHYSAFFHCRSRNQWLIFDDEKIKVVGNTWDDVIDNCCRAHWQPAVLFYERPERWPLSAPSTVPSTQFSVPSAKSTPDASSLLESDVSCATPSSFTSTSVSVALPGGSSLGDGTFSSFTPMHRSLRQPEVTMIGNSPPSSQSSFSNHSITAPINIDALSPSSQTFSKWGHLCRPLSGQSVRCLLDETIGKEIENGGLIMSPAEDTLDDVLPPLVGSPPLAENGADCSTTDKWRATEKDQQAAAAANGELLEKEDRLMDRPKEQFALCKECKEEDLIRNKSNNFRLPKDPLPDLKLDPMMSSMQQAFQCEFVIGQVEMADEFCIKRTFQAFGRRWLLVLERKKRGRDKIHSRGYIAARVQRLDEGEDSLRISICFEWRVQCRSFSSSMPCVTVEAHASVEDPYFICPQRQRQYLAGRKELGLSLTMQLV